MSSMLDPKIGWEYETDKVLLVTYIEGKNDKSFPEDMLARLYIAAQNEGLMESLFPQGVTLNKFIRSVSEKPIVIGYLKGYNGADLQPAGFGWTWERQGDDGARKATIAFVFFRKYWGSREIRALTRLACKWWFEACEIDMLFGMILRTNRLARIFAAEMGFKKIGDVPKYFSRDGKLVDATFVYLSKVDFLESEAEKLWVAETTAVSKDSKQ